MLAVRRYDEKEGFSRAFPHPWLIWEPGVWQPAQNVNDPTETQGGSGAFHPQSTGDALCFELAERRPLKVGRSRGCDIQINDATVSREHLVLQPEPIGTGWIASPTTTNNTTELNGLKLADQSLPLRARDQLRLGDVFITFADPAAMLDRLDEQLRKSQPAPAPGTRR
jgi:hypothetical protein